MSRDKTIFGWSERVRSSWTLAGLIFLMLFVHSAAFIAFQAAAPELRPLPRSAPAIQLLAPFDRTGNPSPEKKKFLEWLQSEDPALVFRVPDAEPTGLLNVPFRPSYLTMRTVSQGVPEDAGTFQYPPARNPLSIIESGASHPAPPAALPGFQPTRIHFSAALSSRAPRNPSIRLKSPASKAIESTQLLIGVSSAGDVRFSFIQRSSGDAALDAESKEFAEALKFSPQEGARMVWGTATFDWGDDAFAVR